MFGAEASHDKMTAEVIMMNERIVSEDHATIKARLVVVNNDESTGRKRTPDEFWREADAIRRVSAGRLHTDSAELLREDRER